MSKVEKEATLKTLCEDGWLKQGDDEAQRLRLGVRSFLEPGAGFLARAGSGAREGTMGEDHVGGEGGRPGATNGRLARGLCIEHRRRILGGAKDARARVVSPDLHNWLAKK